MIVGVEPAMSCGAGEFLTAYYRNRGQANQFAIEASADALDPESFMEIRPEWEGTATELLGISGEQVGEKALRNRKWPKDGRLLSNTFKRVALNLRRKGIRIEWGRENPNRFIRISRKSSVTESPK